MRLRALFALSACSRVLTLPARRTSRAALLARVALGALVAFAIAAAARAGIATEPAETARRAASPAAPPPPVLVVDPGFHTAPVRRIALSADGRLVATASDDKTVALWRAATGQRLHVLRGQPGPGAEGRMYGVAFHPREPLLAIGGTGGGHGGGTGGGTAGSQTSLARIYVHSSESGEFVRAIDAGRGEIKRIAWSTDGRWLLAAFAAPGAVRVFAADGRLAAEAMLGGDGYGVAVHDSGRVAVTDTAGALHLYALGADGRLDTPAVGSRINLGGTPVAAAFSPQGDRLAVVHFDMNRQGSVSILDAAGAPLATWRASALGRGRLQALAWSEDGRRLAIGGVHSPAWATASGRASIDALRGFIQEFDAAGGAPGALHEVASDAITDLRALGASAAPSGSGWAWASFDGRWGTTGPGATAAAAAAERSAARHDPVRRPDRLWLAPSAAAAAKAAAAGRTPGAATAFTIQWQGGADRGPRHFDLAERVVRLGAAAGAVPPEEPGIATGTRDWDSVAYATPTLLGAAMPLAAGEISRAVARIPGSGDVVWGTGQRLARIAAGGRAVWAFHPGTETRAVHASADGAWLVAAMSDGTLRWLRARDGAPLLTLYVHSPQQWVLWSPGGYYDASAGAEPMLGWLLAGLGAHAPADEGARYVSIARFRERLHRPDVIDRLLVDLDEALALERADGARAQALRAEALAGAAAAATPLPASPPTAATASPVPQAAVAVVTPLDPRPDPRADLRAAMPPVLDYKQAPIVSTQNSTVTLDLGLRLAADEKLTSLVVRRDGVLQEDAVVTLPPAAAGSGPVRVTVAVPPGDSVVHVSAANAHGFSDALSFKVHRAARPAALPVVPPAAPQAASASASPGAPPATALPSLPAPLPRAAEPAEEKPRLFALLVGVGRYADPQINPLELPGKDAEDMARVLTAQAGRAYRSVQTRVLTEQRATRAAITAGLEWLARSVGPRDFGMLFIAGHALNHSNGSYYFLGHDVVVDRLATTAVAQVQIRQTLARLKGRAVLFVDTCHAGHVFGTAAGAGAAGAPPATGERGASRDLARLANELASPENGVIVFASSTGRQLSLESREWGNGAFTRALVAGLNGGADLMRRGRITFQGLGYYVSAEVDKLTGGRQTPVVIAPPPGLPDFTLALLPTERLGALPLRPPRGASSERIAVAAAVPLASLAATATAAAAPVLRGASL